VNAGNDEDLDVAASLAIEGIVLPKVDSTSDIPSRDLRYNALIESPTGVEAAFEIARHPWVRGISLGEADLRSATGASEAGLDWPRGRIVNAAVAAGLPRPPQSVYPHVRDLEGLADSCRRGRALGHLGRAAIHPGQLEVIEREYIPTQEEVERARATVERLAAGIGTLDGGAFVDAAMLAGAQQVLAIAEQYG
jgi:citrate lyase subunit beta/citryl-CoA lyase